MTEILVALIGYLTAITVNILTNWRKLKKIEQKIINIEQICRDEYLTTLKLSIISKELPYDERIIAGHNYIAYGGNGKIKKLYDNLVKGGNQNAAGG